MTELKPKDLLLWLLQSPFFLFIGGICFVISLLTGSPLLLIPLVLTAIGGLWPS